MTDQGVKISIAGTPILWVDGSFEIDDSVNTVSTCMFKVRDDSGANHYLKSQQITISDSVKGTVYTGFINGVDEQNYRPNTLIVSSVTVVDNHYLAEKRTYPGPEFTNQYAGIIAVAQLNALAAEGVTAKYALDLETKQSDFAAGTLSGTLATTNVGTGDLELSLAGSAVTISETTTTNFSSGTLVGVTASNNTLSPTSTTAIKFAATMSIPSAAGNTFCYYKIWAGSQSVATGDTLQYSIWIVGTSPEAKIGVDIVFSDGTTMRDTSTAVDSQNIGPHPNQDLAGLATDQWYARSFSLSQYNGKTISYVSIVMEGDKTGNYIGYIKQIQQFDNSSTLKATFFSSSLNVNPPQQLSNYGYSSIAITTVSTYDLNAGGFRISPSYSIDAAKLVQSTLLSWQATTPAGTLVQMKYSIDGNNSSFYCTNNAALPGIPAGLNIAGKSIQLYQFFVPDPAATTPATPEVAPVVSSINLTIASAYNATKNDVYYTAVVGSDWNAVGSSKTNTANLQQDWLTLNGYTTNFDSAFGVSFTVFGVGNTANTFINRRAFSMSLASGASNDIRARLDSVGTWTNFTAEVDVQVLNSGSDLDIEYRTTNWGNSDNSFAYAAGLSTSQVFLGRGTNSTGAGAFTGIASVGLSLSANSWHRLKVVVSGTNHKVYVDDVLFINATDATYAGPGNIALRFFNNSGSTQTAQYDNFGIQAALSGTFVSPSTSLTAAGTYGSSVVQWEDVSQNSQQNSVLVEASINGGTTYQSVSNGGSIPNFTAGQSLSGVSLLIRVTLTTTSASAMPGIKNLFVKVLGVFSSSGTRISPSLSLANVGRLGSSVVAWNASLPTGTTLGVDTAIDGGAWTDVTSSNGGTIPGLTVQPDPTFDTFNTNTRANYTSAGGAGGSAATITYDTANSRIILTNGSVGLYYNSTISSADIDMMADMDYSDDGGLIWRVVDNNNFYLLNITDSLSNRPTANRFFLYKCVAGTLTQLTSATISFTRNTYHRFRVTMIGSAITCYMDGTQIIATTDSAISSAGMMGVLGDSGTSQYYSLRLQPLGQDVTSHSVQTRLRLASTDPTVTPQITSVTLAAFGNTIQRGALIPQTAYTRKYVSDNFDDLMKQSSASGGQWWWYIDKSKLFSFLANNGSPSPWIASDNPGDFLNDVVISNIADLYRNRQIIDNVMATATINESRIGDGVSRSWTFGYEWASAPTITVNGLAASVGVKGVDTGKTFYWAQGDRTITQDSSVATYTNIYTLSFVGTGQYLTYSQYDDTAGQAALAARDNTSGIVENVEDGTGLTKAAGDALAQARVKQFGVLDGKVLKATTLHDGLTPGMLLTVFLPEHGIADTLFLIRNIKKDVFYNGTTGLHQFRYAIEAISGADIGDWTKLYLKQ